MSLSLITSPISRNPGPWAALIKQQLTAWTIWTWYMPTSLNDLFPWDFINPCHIAMPMLSLPISPPGELLPRLLSSLAITILILIFIFQSISSCFRLLAKTQFIWPLDPPFHPCNTASSHLSMPTYDPGEEPGVVQRKPMEDSEEMVQCAVCLCNIEEGEEMRELRCEHLFHRGCLDAWLGYRHLTCPICREALPGKLPDGTEGAELEALMSQYSFLVGSNAHNASIHDSSLSLY